jgi:hypothetical protein
MHNEMRNRISKYVVLLGPVFGVTYVDVVLKLKLLLGVVGVVSLG